MLVPVISIMYTFLKISSRPFTLYLFTTLKHVDLEFTC